MKLAALTLFSAFVATSQAGEPELIKCTKESKKVCRYLFKQGLKHANRQGPDYVAELTGNADCEILYSYNFPTAFLQTDDNTFLFRQGNGNLRCLTKTRKTID